MRYFGSVAVAMWAIALCPQYSGAQGAGDYPNKSVRVIVAAAAGGAADIPTRLFAQRLSETLQHQFIVDNRAGGAGTEAYILASKATPDGYTLLSTPGAFTYGPDLYPQFPDPIRAYTPIGLATRASYLLVAYPGLPANSVKELIVLAKSKPGTLNIGVTNGGFTHVAAAYFASAANIKLTIVPYKASSPIMIDTTTGQLHITFGNVISTLPFVKSGKLRALAVSTLKRSTMLPEVPTVAESGLPGYDISSWLGWLAPAGIPPAIVNKISVELAKAAKFPDVVKRIAEDGGEAVGSTPEEFRKLIAVEVPRWHKVVRDAHMRVE